MSACNFTIPFTGDSQKVLNQARSAVQSQGGTFNGDANSGNFKVAVFGNKIEGSYTVSGQNLNITIDSKPFFVPCNTIENFLSKQIE
ncbi:MAG: hypothetical protein ICV66_07720 [Chitinophagaceae bacterium]|nr:hypothetical protein [Chitinophagaceae bacterium]